MIDVAIRIEGRAGRITLTRPKALNALTHGMVRAIDAALIAWAGDPAVAVVVIDAEGERAFCAGGDIAAIHATGSRGDYGPARAFWREEYRMNARLGAYGKPVVALMQGFVMGGGVGLGGHVSHRVVGAGTRVAMPECGIGLVPDVGGSALLARAPLGLGRYLGLTGARMGPGCAILAGFADHYLPEERWPALIARLVAEGDADAVAGMSGPPPESPLGAAAPAVGWAFGAGDVAAILDRLDRCEGDWVGPARKALERGSPLSMAVTLAMLERLGGGADLAGALAQEYRATHRLIAEGDLVEGIRALIIDKDNAPRWRHAGPGAVTPAEAAGIIAPLGDDELSFEEDRP
ncbi:MAG: 3-hydroxyisobutyryl-CoA hydrolase [Alkalilacustris sp.]